MNSNPLLQLKHLIFYSLIFAISSCDMISFSANNSTKPSFLPPSSCYNGSIEGVQEYMDITFQEDSLIISGYRLIETLMKNIEMNGKGTFSGNLATLHINYLNPKEPEHVFQTVEQWTFDSISVRKNIIIDDISVQMNAYRIQCSHDETSDTTLYDTFGGFYEGYSVVSKYGLFGLIDSTFQISIPMIYKDLEIVNERSIVFYDPDSGLRGILDVNGDTIIPAIYDDIHCFNHGVAACLNNGKWGFINRSGNFIIPPIYLEVNLFKPEASRHPFNEGLANVKNSDGTWIYIDVAGNQVIPDNYLFAKSFSGGRAEVYHSEKWRTIDKNGNCVENCN